MTNKEPKYTSGPWHVRFCDDRLSMNMTVITTDSGRDAFIHDNFNNEPDTIAIVLHQCEPFVGCDFVDCGDANAKLISAAPDLLQALELALPILKQYAMSNEDAAQCHLTAEQAIQKALTL